MIKTITLTNSWLAVRRLFFVAFFLLFVTIVFYCCFYLFSGHDYLVKWYTRLNDCFYNGRQWGTDFFTTGVKADGNIYCIMALLIALAGIWYILKRIRTKDLIIKYPLTIRYDTRNILPVIISLVTVAVLWTWGNRTALPANDEVFSAQNAAGINPFQCISYYMQPNNHLFFNFLNNLLFHPSIDKVITGRIISFVAYGGFIISAFFWVKGLVQNRWLALLISITLAHQFFIWGFSFQARGYELYLLAEWGSFIALFSYIMSSQKRWLYVNLLCTAFGYFCLPSLLYFHAAQMVFVLLYQLFFQKKEILYWKYQLAAILLTFLFYLPTLCFSGLEAITHNNYVAPMAGCKTIASFWNWMFPTFRTYIGHIFSNISWQGFDIGLILFLLPLTLLFSRRNKVNFLFGLFYLSLWMVFFVIVTVMKRLPFERNLVGHYSFALAGVLITAYSLTGLSSKKGIVIASKWVMFPAVMILFIIHFACTNENLLKETLYEYDVNGAYKYEESLLSIIPAGSTVAFSDGRFYAYYICRRNGCIVSKCPKGNEDYYIKYTPEALPQELTGKYTLINNTYGEETYKRK